VRSIPVLCGLRVSTESYVIQRAPCNTSHPSTLYTHSVTTDTHPGASSVGAPTSPVNVLPCESSYSVLVAEETTRRSTVAILSGKKRMRYLQRTRPNAPIRKQPRSNLPLRKLGGLYPLPRRWTWTRGGITSSECAR